MKITAAVTREKAHPFVIEELELEEPRSGGSEEMAFYGERIMMNANSSSATEMLVTATRSAHDGLLKFETLLRSCASKRGPFHPTYRNARPINENNGIRFVIHDSFEYR
jgi:hypothetical protein